MICSMTQYNEEIMHLVLQQSFCRIIVYRGGIPKWWKYRILFIQKTLCLKCNDSHCFIYNVLIQFSTGPENFQSLNTNLPKPFPIFSNIFSILSSQFHALCIKKYFFETWSTLGFQFEFVSSIVFHQMNCFVFGIQILFEV